MDKGDISFGFLLLPHFSLSALGQCTDLLGLLGRESLHPFTDRGWGRHSAAEQGASADNRCSWEIVAETLIPVRSASGIQVVPTHLLGDPARFDVIVVVGGPDIPPRIPEATWRAWLRQGAQLGRTLVGLGHGVFTLAEAGVLRQHQACVDGQHYRAFHARFPAMPVESIITDRQYVFDRNRVTCAGGDALWTVMARILRRHIDPALIHQALRRLQIDESRSHRPLQPPPEDLPPDLHPAVRRAALIIQQYAGQALSLAELSNRLGISPRQLQRLFKAQLAMSPQTYARRTRLHLAAWMLRHSDKNIAAIASDCGFADSAHLGRAFRDEHGVPPGIWRSRARKEKKAL